MGSVPETDEKKARESSNSLFSERVSDISVPSPEKDAN